MDVHKESIEIAIADDGANGEVRRFGRIGGTILSQGQPWNPKTSGKATSGHPGYCLEGVVALNQTLQNDDPTRQITQHCGGAHIFHKFLWFSKMHSNVC